MCWTSKETFKANKPWIAGVSRSRNMPRKWMFNWIYLDGLYDVFVSWASKYSINSNSKRVICVPLNCEPWQRTNKTLWPSSIVAHRARVVEFLLSAPNSFSTKETFRWSIIIHSRLAIQWIEIVIIEPLHSGNRLKFDFFSVLINHARFFAITFTRSNFIRWPKSISWTMLGLNRYATTTSGRLCLKTLRNLVTYEFDRSLAWSF